MAEAPVVMGDGLLPPCTTATVVTECNSAAAIVLLPVSLGEEGGGGFHLQGSAWCSQPQQTGAFLLLWFLRRGCGIRGDALLRGLQLIIPSPRPALITGNNIRGQNRALLRRLLHPRRNFKPPSAVNNYLSRQTSDQ